MPAGPQPPLKSSDLATNPPIFWKYNFVVPTYSRLWKYFISHSSLDLLSICQMGCCPVHRQLNEANRICNIYSVDFCFITLIYPIAGLKPEGTMFPSTKVTLWPRGQSPKQKGLLQCLLLSHLGHDQNHTDRGPLERLHSDLLRYLLSYRLQTRRSHASFLICVMRRRNTEYLFYARHPLWAKGRAWGFFLSSQAWEYKANWFDSIPNPLCKELPQSYQ